MADTEPTAELAQVTAEVTTIADAPRALGLVVPHRLGPSSHVDHFVVFEVLGEGGMATVYGAYDTRLDRRVAVKVVRADRLAARAGERDRLLREARAMARLAHPNVVTVLEVGEIGHDIYIALEYVDGMTLRRWLRAAPRSLAEIVAAFLQAGRGLAAVHAAGLVHGDVKPDNVLVRRDGRVQLTDFGAVTQVVPTPSEADPASRWAPGDEAGMKVGSPAYMAPEQHAGRALDARTDQFAFCVSLWEAVYKQRPFLGRTSEEIAAAIKAGALTPPPAAASAPRWLDELVRRGLARRPDDRWPDLGALLAALGRDRAAARRRALVAAGVACLVAGSLGVAWAGWTRTPARARCADAAHHLAGAWDPPIAGAIAARFAATGAPFAAASARQVSASLDAWSARWAAMRVAACEASANGEQSAAMLDARMQCLDRRRDELAALTALLVRADRDGVAKAASAASQLYDVAACGDREALAATTPLPVEPVARERVAAVLRELARAEALQVAGQYRDGRAVATKAAAAAQAAAHPSLVADALIVRGELEAEDGAPRDAEATLRAAVIAAATARDDRALARGLVGLVGVLEAQARSVEALALGVAAAAATARVRDPRLAASLHTRLGHAEQTRGSFALAERHYERASTALAATADASAFAAGEVLNLRGALEERRGQPARARGFYERAAAAAEAAVGRAHPTTAVSRANLCHLDFVAGALAQARACQEEVAATLEAGLGEGHPLVAWALNDVALIQETQGDLAGARARFERALAIWEHTSGEAHADVVWPLVNLGQLAADAGDDARAAALCRRAVKIVEATAGAEHPDLGFPLTCLGQALIAGDPREAAAVLRRALARFAVAVADPTDAASTRFLLARALDRAGDRAAAIAEARAARGVLAAGGPASAPTLDAVTAWLRARGVR